MAMREGPEISFYCRGTDSDTSGPHGWVPSEESGGVAYRWVAGEIEESMRVCRQHASQLRRDGGWRVSADEE